MRTINAIVLALAFIVTAGAQDIDRLVSEYGRSVPKIKATNNHSSWSTGSGVYLGKLWCLSAKHVVDDANHIYAEFAGVSIPVDTYVFSKNTDQVLLKLSKDPQARPVPLVRANSATLVYAAGYDHGRRLRFWSGRPGAAWNQHTREFFGEGGSVEGNSGGPVLTSSGCIGNLWGRQQNSCVFTGNDSTLDFIERAAVRYPDLRALLPYDGSGDEAAGVPSPSPQMTPIGITCPTCPTSPSTGIAQPLPEPEVIATPPPVQPEVIATPSKVPATFDANIIPRFTPRITPNNASVDVPVDIPLEISVRFTPQISLGAER